jgi:hypothetical protein
LVWALQVVILEGRFVYQAQDRVLIRRVGDGRIKVLGRLGKGGVVDVPAVIRGGIWAVEYASGQDR